MEFTTIKQINNNFCKDKVLTDTMVGKLANRDIKVLAPGSILGRLIHVVRYFFSKEYHRQFDKVAQEYIDHLPKLPNRDIVVLPNHKSLQLSILKQDQPLPPEQVQKPSKPIKEPQTNAPLSNTDSPEKSTSLSSPASPNNVPEPVKVADAAPVEPRIPGVDCEFILNKIKENLGPNAANLWRTLFTRFATSNEYGSEWLSSISHSGNDETFRLYFTKPMKIHVVSTEIGPKGEFEDPEGGVVMTFGEKDEPLTIKIEPGIMHLGGLGTFSRLPNNLQFLGKHTVEARLISFQSRKDEEFTLTGFKKILFKDTYHPVTKTYAKILENWGKKATILPSDAEPKSVIFKK